MYNTKTGICFGMSSRSKSERRNALTSCRVKDKGGRASRRGGGRGGHLGVLYEGGEVDDWAVQDCKQQDGDAGEDHIIGGSADAIHQSLPTEAVVELVVEQHKGEADVLIEGVLDEAGEAVAGQAAVHQQQAHQEPELPNGVVRVVHCLQQQ